MAALAMPSHMTHTHHAAAFLGLARHKITTLTLGVGPASAVTSSIAAHLAESLAACRSLRSVVLDVTYIDQPSLRHLLGGVLRSKSVDILTIRRGLLPLQLRLLEAFLGRVGARTPALNVVVAPDSIAPSQAQRLVECGHGRVSIEGVPETTPRGPRDVHSVGVRDVPIKPSDPAPRDVLVAKFQFNHPRRLPPEVPSPIPSPRPHAAAIPPPRPIAPFFVAPLGPRLGAPLTPGSPGLTPCDDQGDRPRTSPGVPAPRGASSRCQYSPPRFRPSTGAKASAVPGLLWPRPPSSRVAAQSARRPLAPDSPRFSEVPRGPLVVLRSNLPTVRKAPSSRVAGPQPSAAMATGRTDGAALSNIDRGLGELVSLLGMLRDAQLRATDIAIAEVRRLQDRAFPKQG